MKILLLLCYLTSVLPPDPTVHLVKGARMHGEREMVYNVAGYMH